MEKVNAMKKIALFLMVVALAVVFTACQGAVGKAGDEGTAGDSGTQGTPGSPGPQGFSQLVAMERVKPLWVNNGPDARGKSPIGPSLIGPDGVAIPLPASIDPAVFFFGGADVKYSLVVWDWDDYLNVNNNAESAVTPDATIDPMSVFTVSMAADGTLTIAKRATGAHMAGDELSNADDAARDAADQYHYGRGTRFRLKATDSVTKLSVESDTIPIVRNGRPHTDGDNVDGSGPVTVGEQSGFPAAATPEQKMDPCNAINVVCVNLRDSDPSTANDEERWFHDPYEDHLIFTPTPVTGSGGFVSAAMGVDHNDANIDDNPGYLLMVTGLKAGVAADGTTPAVKMTEIEVIATDDGGLSTKAGEEAVLVVNVDPAPRAKSGVSPSTREVTSPTTAAFAVLNNVRRFFEDNEDGLLFTAKIKTNADGAIGVPTTDVPLIDQSSFNLMVDGLSPGTAVITITASEPYSATDPNARQENAVPMLGQSVTLDVTVTVK